MQQLTSLTNQRGASVTTIILGLAAASIIIKLGLAIIPDYITDYQFNKFVLGELQKANESKASEKQFIDSLDKQMGINASYDMKAKEVVTFTNKTPGGLAVKTNYSTQSVFYGNTIIVNRFSADITSQGITKIEPEIGE